ncbi:MAG: tyrosine-type recombinase/integrase [Bacteroidales bacterium]|nr:tyrosine-type recombinase/integrase [Bacteroidales bacterium]
MPKDSPVSNRSRYLNALYRTNRHLKTIARMMGLNTPLTMYVSRHSWASIAHSRQIPLSVISAGLGHDSEKTTQIYLDELNPAIIDENNAKILNDLM